MDVARVCVCLVGLAAGQQARAALETSTPVPILRYIDSQNADGSYTYGFEGADGTYKLETREADGSVRGKYGYYDPEGRLREPTYGSTKEFGFEPKVAGFQQPRAPVIDTRLNEVEEPVAVSQQAAPRSFANFSPRKAAGEARKSLGARNQGVKIVNGRRAVLKRRLVKRPPTARPEEVANRDNLRARQQQLNQLRQQRRQLEQLQQQQQPSPRRESFRSIQSFTPTALVGPEEPFVSYGKEAGSYTISY